MNYMNDDNRDAIRRMAEAGDDLTRPRQIEFTVVFPNENAAERFATEIRGLGYEASAELTGTDEKLPWDVVVRKEMIPKAEQIGAFEAWLKQVADALGRRNDGWGCFSNPPQ